MQKLTVIACGLILFALASCGKKGGAAPDPSAIAGNSAAGCAGSVVGGFCWYLGAAGQSCTTVCASHSGFNAGTLTFAGSSGTLANCQAVIISVSGPYSGASTGDNVCGGVKIGCNLAPGNNAVRCNFGPTDASSTIVNAQRTCACNN
jgi:hypothetical protein